MKKSSGRKAKAEGAVPADGGYSQPRGGAEPSQTKELGGGLTLFLTIDSPNDGAEINAKCLPYKVTGTTGLTTSFMQYLINNGGFPKPVQLNPPSGGQKTWVLNLDLVDLPTLSPPDYLLTIIEFTTGGVMITTDRNVNCTGRMPCTS